MLPKGVCALLTDAGQWGNALGYGGVVGRIPIPRPLELVTVYLRLKPAMHSCVHTHDDKTSFSAGNLVLMNGGVEPTGALPPWAANLTAYRWEFAYDR